MSPVRFLLFGTLTAVAMLVAICALPHSRYVRFISLQDAEVVKLGWIYERIHYDPTPIDVAFIGTSHTVFGVDSGAVEAACRVAGGLRCSTENFAIQHLGRNLHWLLSRELLKLRRPRLLVIEVQESELRALHPAAPYIADVSDLVNAPLLLNPGYLSDLSRLPIRQLTLFFKTTAPDAFGVRVHFAPTEYYGRHWNDVYREVAMRHTPNAWAKARTANLSAATLEAQRRESAAKLADKVSLPPSLRALESRANVVYLRQVIELARATNVPVRFLYLPGYRGQSHPELACLYSSLAPVWYLPEQLLSEPSLWQDANHLNSRGAQRVSEWLGHALARG